MPEQAAHSEIASAGKETTPALGSEISLKPVSKTKETLNLFSMAIPIIGFIGTIFVWIFANFYLGSVEIQTPGQYNEISISVFDKKGQESTVHTPQFQLMPGKYHLTVTVDKNSPQQLDTEVALGKTSLIKVTGNPISTTSAASDDSSAGAPHTVHKHWWQFWKKDNSNVDSHDDPANDSVE